MAATKNRSLIWKVVVVIALFIALLTAARFLWMETFAEEEDANIEEAVLDLRTENEAMDEILALNGEWEFYPSTFIMEDDLGSSERIEVPGDWTAHLPDEDKEEASYGYGSYRLKIYVDADDDTVYNLRVPSVRSSSELYVNGKKVGGSGSVGKSVGTYTAKNLPFSASFNAEDGVIDVVLQVANFRDPRSSGLVRSIKFSAKENLAAQTSVSKGLQQMIMIVFLMHSIYAIVLYILGRQDRRLMYVALFVMSSVVMFGLGLEEKTLNVWIPIDYIFAFRLSTIALVGIGYFLYKSVQEFIPPVGRKIMMSYEVACLLSVISILFLPLNVFLNVQQIYFALTFISFVLAIYILFRVSVKQLKQNILLLFALVAFFHNSVWTFIMLFSGLKMMYYPFDFIIAVLCVVAYWFQQYFKMHRETERLSIKLQEEDQLKDDFLANTSHELRNPLHAVLNISHAVYEREKDYLQKASKENLETILSIGRRMSTMLNDILDVMTFKERAPRLQQQTMYVQSMIHGVFDMLKFTTEGKQIQLINDLPDDFPPVYADENRVIQVLFNLIHNGIKYTEEGHIRVAGYMDGKKAYIAVEDTGIGMDADTRDVIFDSYQQGETAIQGGFGLGLSISHQLIELHEGKLVVDSTQGEGATFTFSLPLSTEQDRQASSHIAPEQDAIRDVMEEDTLHLEKEMSLPLIERPRILVVDDDQMNLEVMETILSTEPYDVTTVTSGEAALEILHRHEWDLVISDVMMPYMSGYELAREIRKRFTLTELPILLLTARASSADIEQGFLVGANDYVAKPVETFELRSRVRALTGVRKSMREQLRMEAAWLQAQIQPHFLFNALNTIMALSEIDHKRMQRVLEAFSDLLRGKFNFQNVDDLVAIRDEIDLIEAYLYIEQERFGPRLQVEWDVGDVCGIYLPPLTIQPLVENAIHHGIMSQVKGGTLRISIQKEETFARISVEDDGAGMTEEEQNRLLQRDHEGRTGVGILNTHLRLKRQFNSGLEISSEEGKGTTVTFTIPLMEE